MTQRGAAAARSLPVFLFILSIMLSAVVGAQKSPATVAGAPLKGVDVKLGRYGGAQFAGGGAVASTKTDENGNFTFPVLPKGEYVLTVSLPEGPGHGKCYITLNLADGGKVEKGYDLTQNLSFDPASPSTAKTSLAPLVFVSNGSQPCNGTIVKSKSNISNN